MNKDLWYSTGNYTQYFIKTCQKGKESDNRSILNVFVCMIELLCHIPETKSTVNQLYFNKN